MTSDLLQILLFIVLLVALAPPLGGYMARVYLGERTLLSPVLGPVERGLYAMAGVDARKSQHWTGYAIACLAFNAVGFLLLYVLLRLQDVLPFNPQGLAAVPPDLAFNSAVSFVTNTNWQAYGGEATLSYLSQMAGMTTQNFVSAATGMAVAAAVIRGFAQKTGGSLGNFWVDMTRSTLYVLLPLSIVVAFLLIAQGVPQTLSSYLDATTLEGAKQSIAVGPAASQIAIKQLGTNGGGFFNANSAHPFENPTAISNLIQVLAILLIPAAFCFTYGRMVGDKRQGRAIFAAMSVLFLIGLAAIYVAELRPNPLLSGIVDGVNMEGKEVRFGLGNSVLWSAATTVASNGSVNAMHDSFQPLSGLVQMLNIQLGEIIFGGVGSGLYGMLLYVVLTVFLAGLMVGRTPEYLGKKIEGREVKLAVLAFLSMPLGILALGALSVVLPAGVASVQDAGPHGLSEILYAYSSATGNNGSAFAGFGANTAFQNRMLGLCMLIGRYAFIVPLLAIAGSLAMKTAAAPSAGTFPTHGPLFVTLLTVTILILGALTYLPVLALGPIAEHVSLLAGQAF